MRVEPPDRSGLVARELDEVRRPRLPIRQRPTKTGMVADACGHVFGALVTHRRRYRERRTTHREVDIELETKRIDLQRASSAVSLKVALDVPAATTSNILPRANPCLERR